MSQDENICFNYPLTSHSYVLPIYTDIRFRKKLAALRINFSFLVYHY